MEILTRWNEFLSRKSSNGINQSERKGGNDSRAIPRERTSGWSKNFPWKRNGDHRNGLRSFEQAKVERWPGTRRGEAKGGLPYRASRRAVKSIARYFAPPRAASFRREILLTSFRVSRTQPPSFLRSITLFDTFSKQPSFSSRRFLSFAVNLRNTFCICIRNRMGFWCFCVTHRWR